MLGPSIMGQEIQARKQKCELDCFGLPAAMPVGHQANGSQLAEARSSAGLGRARTLGVNAVY